MDDHTVGILGDDPATATLQATLAQTDLDCREIGRAEITEPDLVVVSDTVGASIFEATSADRATWIALEHAGLGGHALPDVDVGISVFGEQTGCYQCLCRRVAANTDTDPPTPDRVAPREARFAGAIASHLVELRLDTDRSPAGTVIELPYTERTLLPVPHCACAPDRDWAIDRSFTSVSLDTASGRAEHAIDARLGIVQSIGEIHSFPVPYYLTASGDTSGFSDVTAGQHAAGVAEDWNRAFMKAVGEALERYSAGVYRTAAFTQARPADLADAIPPSRFVRPDTSTEAGGGEPVAWIRGEALDGADAVYLPADCVVFPPPEEYVRPAITTGLGLGSSGCAALLAGLYEIIERDATMLAWYSSYDPLRLEVENEAFAAMRRRARSEDLSVTPLLVTQDIDVPVVTVAVHRDAGWPRFAVGSSAGLDPDVAARGALEEALQNWLELRDMGREQAAGDEPRLADYADFPDPARALIDVDGKVSTARLREDESKPGEAALSTVVSRLAEVGLTGYGVRLTTRDLERLGFEAARVVVPEAQPLFTGDPFFGDRARTVPAELGFEPRLDRPPHPYP